MIQFGGRLQNQLIIRVNLLQKDFLLVRVGGEWKFIRTIKFKNAFKCFKKDHIPLYFIIILYQIYIHILFLDQSLQINIFS